LVANSLKKDGCIFNSAVISQVREVLAFIYLLLVKLILTI
jgi:hypothetical protein